MVAVILLPGSRLKPPARTDGWRMEELSLDGALLKQQELDFQGDILLRGNSSEYVIYRDMCFALCFGTLLTAVCSAVMDAARRAAVVRSSVAL